MNSALAWPAGWFLAALILASGAGPSAAQAAAGHVPRLIVLLSVDQLRADYLTRFRDLFLPAVSTRDGRTNYGGFRLLQEHGAWFADAHHTHYPLSTAPGHAALLTGAYPYKSGIVGNYWYDPVEKKDRRYSAEDLTTRGQLVGTQGLLSKKPYISPVPLQVSTVGDELRMATGSKAKVWGLALKDRAAVLMAGHLANGVAWFDEDTGDWVSSRYYFPSNALPSWLTEVNTKLVNGSTRFVDTFTNLTWRFTDQEAASRVWAGPRDFSHRQSSTNYKDFTFTPYGNQFVLETARRLIEHEQLGGDDVPDILALNFSSNDYVGHKYGSVSAEVVDITVRLDRQLGDFFTWINQRIGLGQVLLILTSDHGAAPTPGDMREKGHFLGAGVVDDRALEADLNRTLTNWFGLRAGYTNTVRLIEYNLFVHTEALRTDRPAAEIHQVLADYIERSKPMGIYAAYTRERITRGQLPRTDLAERVMRGFHPDNSGDIVLVPRAFSVHLEPKYPYLTSHGSPYSYDTAVPLLLVGPGIRPGRHLEPISILDLAPTLSCLLGILPPSGSEGSILPILE